MKFMNSSPGMLSGFCTSTGLVPHLLVLAILLIAGVNPPVIFLIIFTISAKILGEWFFRSRGAKKIDEKKDLPSCCIPNNQELLLHPNIWIALIIICVDVLAEGILVLNALKTAISPVLILFAFLGCQALSAPIQGALSDIYSKKKSLLFAVIASMLAIAVFGGVSLDGMPKNPSMNLLNNLFRLHIFSPGVQMILILCAKGLLGNTTVIARSAIMEVIRDRKTNPSN